LFSAMVLLIWRQEEQLSPLGSLVLIGIH